MNQKKLVFLTLVVVVAGAVFVNEMIVKPNAPEQDREMASATERYQPEQIKWEQELAKSVSREANGQTVIGAKPTLREKFLYEALEGHYEAQVVNGRILKISLMPNREALDIDFANVIKKYSSVFKDAKSFARQPAALANGESLRLQSADAQTIGLVTVERNAQGRVVSLEIQ
jgi:hypothetical protein